MGRKTSNLTRQLTYGSVAVSAHVQDQLREYKGCSERFRKIFQETYVQCRAFEQNERERELFEEAERKQS